MTQFLFSQDSKISLEVNFPISLGNNFFGEDYNGIVDVGAKYRIVNISNLNLGISVNGSYFKKKAKLYIPSYPGDFQNPYDASEITNFTILPRAFAELTLESLPKLRPFVGLGYGFLIFNTASRGVASPSSSVTLNGLNGNVGAYYLLTNSIYAQLQYDYIKLFDEDVLGQPDANNVSIIKFGLGLLL
ncbi:MAG TPA: outer membrane beta-barrel protein [Aequorivita sp.]|nr:outer membrane beta-barrel protein [Aequorivita sp.]